MDIYLGVNGCKRPSSVHHLYNLSVKVTGKFVSWTKFKKKKEKKENCIWLTTYLAICCYILQLIKCYV